ncbi:adenylate/guanylate cyclase domain-containing protein [Rhodobacteraceae bacterium NNCM2]|nr:adenylate/guanylate cyclase domain-containing protein [Coraliihabitans acroporae]
MTVRMTQTDADFAREEQASLTYMFRGRLAVLLLLGLWVTISLPFERSASYLIALGVFVVLGAAPYLLTRRGFGGTPVIALFLMLDAAVLSYLLIVPNPYGLEGWSPQMNLRSPGFLYLGLFLVYMALSYKPALVVWAGVAAVVCWSVGVLWVMSLPETRLLSSRDVLDEGLDLNAALARFLDPQAVGSTRLVNQIVFLSSATLILTLTVWRSRQLVRRQVATERQRMALSRYFSPNIVRELASNDHPLDQPKMQPVAVLFADMVGFTAISERLEPAELVGLLRAFHGRLARVALRHGGTIDKYIGDSIMVHFGTPEPRDDDAARALRCAGDMIAEIEDWNTSRAAEGDIPIRVGIGLHYGDVIVGNIGDENRLEYTVLGDPVNVASRLEALTRKLDASLVTSDPLIDAVRTSDIDPMGIIPGLQLGEAEEIRGRAAPVKVWYKPANDAAGDG